MTENYRGCYEYLSAQFEQVGGSDFYRELFPDNELYGVKYDDFSHPSAVYPVSYTHLDVYKRQLCISIREKMSGFIDGRCITIPGSRTIRSLWSKIP